jgi:ERF superfamily protein
MTEAAPTPPRARRRANGQHPPPAAVQPIDPVLAMIERVARDPTADLEKLQRLLDMRAKVEAEAREHAFNDALAAAQAQMQPIVADAVNSQIGNRYATYAALDRAIRPIYTSHGLALTFTTGATPILDAVEIVAYLIGHGHSRRYSVVMPADGKGARGDDVMSRTHATASAISYGMRQVLRMAFNLAVDATTDDDGNAAGKVRSSASPKRENVWRTFQDEMRGANSMLALQTVVANWRPRVVHWSDKWRNAAETLHGQCQAKLRRARPSPTEQTP